MKTIVTVLVLVLAFFFSTFASNYEEAMKKNIEKMYTLQSSAELMALANQFDRIARAETNKWLPAYYAAYCFTSSTFFDNMETDEKHKQLDKAQTILDGLKKNFSAESEIYALQAFVYQLRITDMSKGYKYSKLAGEAITTAEKPNTENPRVYYLRGSNTFHTPKFFGGGAEKAKPDLAKASEMFKNNIPENELMPKWGGPHNNQLLNKCD